jgi:hypothetical protein
MDVVGGEWFRWLHGLTGDFWAKNAKIISLQNKRHEISCLAGASRELDQSSVLKRALRGSAVRIRPVLKKITFPRRSGIGRTSGLYCFAVEGRKAASRLVGNERTL